MLQVGSWDDMLLIFFATHDAVAFPRKVSATSAGSLSHLPRLLLPPKRKALHKQAANGAQGAYGTSSLLGREGEDEALRVGYALDDTIHG